MVIVIPYKPDIHDGLELFYCLRSIEKNLKQSKDENDLIEYCTGFSDLIIIGKPPGWFKGKWIYTEDYPGRKQYTIYQKLLFACHNFTYNFIMWNDDHFLIKQSKVSDIKWFHNGLLSDELHRGLSARYREAVNNTIQFQSGYNFDIHTPIIFNKAQFRKLFTNKTEEVCIKSYYCNALGIQGEYMTDCKIDQLLSKEAIKELIKDRLFFSTGSNGVREPMKELLQEMFPNKSRWEK